MATPNGIAVAARQAASGYALRGLPRPKDLHHFLGHQLALAPAGLAATTRAKKSRWDLGTHKGLLRTASCELLWRIRRLRPGRSRL